MQQIYLNQYESLGKIGSGGMGDVFLARPINDPARSVVVKVLKPQKQLTKTGRESIIREMQFAGHLHHPYIVELLDRGIDPVAGPCLVYEFVPGSLLRDILRVEKRLDLPRCGWLLGCICHALQTAHLAGIVHRDLKPGNIMVVGAGTSEELVKVMDFGIASAMTQPYLTTDQLAGKKDVVRTQGTPKYISPEQLRGETTDARADIYCLGVMLYEMVTGQLPFPYEDVGKLIDAHLKAAPPSFASIQVFHIPPQIERLILNCLSKYPPERPGSAGALAKQFGVALGTDIWDATRPAGVREVVPLAESLPDMPEISSNEMVFETDAWMPDAIASMKLGGFLTSIGATILDTQPGKLDARFDFAVESPKSGWLGKIFPKKSTVPIRIRLELHRPNVSEGKIHIRMIMNATEELMQRNSVRTMCEALFAELKKFL
ncbi:MAG: serine/threonine-protein kinase [Zavarzinella sp.]